MLLPVVAAAVALVAALAGFAMVKFFGVIFLGQPREEKLSEARDAGPLERLGLLWLALGCVLLGLLPNAVIALLDPVTRLLIGVSLRDAATDSWWLLTPINADRASYSALAFFVSLAVLTPLVSLVVHRIQSAGVRRAPAWDCGFPLQTPRMQDTAEGFGQLIRRIFDVFLRRTRTHPSPFDKAPVYRSVVEDPIWHWLYLPIARLVEYGAHLAALLQQGRIAIYLLYSFVTLIALLVLTRG